MSEIDLKNDQFLDENAPNYKPRVLIISGVVGAMVGILAAFLYLQNLEEGTNPEVTPGQGVKIGLLLLSLIRNVADLA